MFTFGLVIATIGVIGLTVSAIQEKRTNEKKYLIIAKITSGILGIGGILLGIAVLGR